MTERHQTDEDRGRCGRSDGLSKGENADDECCHRAQYDGRAKDHEQYHEPSGNVLEHLKGTKYSS